MSTVKKIIYDSNLQSKFIHNVNEVDILLDGAEFKLVDVEQTGNQSYVDDTGFTYDPLLAEFISGTVKKIDQRPTDALTGIKFLTDEDANWTPGTPAGTLNNGASVAAGVLNLSAGVTANCSFNGDVFPLTNKGAVKLKIKMLDALIGYIWTAKTAVSEISIRKASTLAFIFTIKNDNGTSAIDVLANVTSMNIGNWSELEINFDGNTKEYYVMWNGEKVGSDITGTITKTIPPTDLIIGADNLSSTGVNADIKDVVLFSELQHSADYATGYTVPNRIYLASNVENPDIPYAGPGVVKSIVSVVSTGTNVPPITTTFDDDSVHNQINFEESNDQEIIDSTVTKYIADFYPEYSLIEPTEHSTAQGFEDLVDDHGDFVGDGQINYICKIELAYYYLNASVLEVADKTFVQSNTISEWLANKAVVDALIDSGARVTFLPIPYSGANRDENFKLVSTTLSYDFFPISVGCEQCTLYGFLNDNCYPVKDVTVTISTPKPIYTQGKVQAFSVNAEVELSNGSFEVPLVIPNLPAVTDRTDDYYLLNAIWKDQDDLEWKLVDVKIIIPNQPTVLFNEDIIKKGR